MDFTAREARIAGPGCHWQSAASVLVRAVGALAADCPWHPDGAARLLREALVEAVDELGSLPADERRRRRRRKFREMGVYA